MSLFLFLPGLATVLLGSAVGLVSAPLRPLAALRLFTVVAGVAAATTVVVAVAVSLGFVARFGVISSLVEWCPIIPAHHRVGFLEGIVAVAALFFMSTRTWKVLSCRRQAMQPTRGRRFALLETDEPIAYAAPGKPGCVVVSRGLLSGLTARERQVVFAHERAHLDQGHDRYLLVAALSVAICPLLAPLSDRVRLQTERCADEAAVDALGGDRNLVATAIARAAVATTVFGGAVPSFGGGSVVMRVGALSEPRLGPNLGATFSAFAVVFIGATATTSIQIHHFAELVAHVCGR